MTLRSLHRTALIATWSTLALIAFGGYTRGSGSGYGCKDRWPLCENGALGGYLPRLESEMIVEWTHRWIALLVGFVAITLVVGAIRGKHDRGWVIAPAISAIVVIGFQAWLGRMVVKGDLDRDLVTVHLAVSMLVVAHFVVIAVATSARRSKPAAPRDWRVLLGVGAVAVFVVMVLGSVVHNLYFPGWPLPGGSLAPDTSSSDALIHYFHRAFSGWTLLLLAFLAWFVRRIERPQIEKSLVDIALAGFLVNAVLGLVHVLTEVQSSFVVAAHIGVAGIVWAALVAAFFVAVRSTESVAMTSLVNGER
ncbi:MAG: COX15/CtaA family protein [Actinomycetia bacterium]|nr:COX15/CtaA family protein [Actinomycetes bacterium]